MFSIMLMQEGKASMPQLQEHNGRSVKKKKMKKVLFDLGGMGMSAGLEKNTTTCT